jgi:hypothetical protein
MPLDFPSARPLLQKCDPAKLFIEELGWDPCRAKLPLRVAEKDYTFTTTHESTR